MRTVRSWGGPARGKVGFKGSRKSTPFAAQLAADDAAKQVLALGMRKVEVMVKGPGAGSGSGDSLAVRRRAPGPGHQGRDAHSTQRVSPSETTEGLGVQERTPKGGSPGVTVVRLSAAPIGGNPLNGLTY